MNPPFGDPAQPAANRWLWWAVTAVLSGAVVLTLLLTARYLPTPTPAQTTPPTSVSSPPANLDTSSPIPASLPEFEVEAVSVLEGDANWYDVPENSLPQRRAWPGEFTAASNRIKPNTYVRVRRLDHKGDPDKPIVVRITDDGVGRKSTVIDLDRQAAEALGMVKAGQVRVRVEILALRHADASKPVEKKDSPTAAKASALTDQPTASEQQEKDAAAVKQ